MPARVLDEWRERRYLLVTAPAIIREIRSTLKYPRIRKKYALADRDIEDLIAE